MNTLIWLLKVNAAIILLYAFYKLLFQRDTFFGAKRTILLSAICFALVYPLFDVRELFLSENAYFQTNILTFELPEFLVLPNLEQAQQSLSFVNLATGIWIAGMILFFSYFVFQVISILHKILISKRMQLSGMNVRVLDGLKTPFSFFNCILINPNFHNEQEISEILHHEKTHAEQGHTFDVIFSELFCILCWFNPFAWLLKKEIRMNLEFLADNQVMQSVENTEHYQLHLLRLSYNKAIKLSNNFNVSPLKKRIQMMNKKKSSNAGAIKYILFVPLAAVMLLVASCIEKKPQENVQETVSHTQESAQETIPQSQVINDDALEAADDDASREVFHVVDQMPQFPGGDREFMSFMRENTRYPVVAQEAGIQGRVTAQFVVNSDGSISDIEILRGVHPSLDAEAIRVIEAMPKWIPGRNQGGEAVNVLFRIPINFRLP